jgi:hypothetical protein
MQRNGNPVLDGLDALLNLLRTQNPLWEGLDSGTEANKQGVGRQSPVGTLERTAFGGEGGPLFLLFKSVTQMPRVMEIRIQSRFWRAPHAERRISMRRHVSNSVKTSPR